ncbi:hypothetical protein [Salmonirosea aquatica]|uniref:Uncharacterized protein n=1 Tax=Salmonirosea aquatica TaxID=2654236 RepID=A0A7C9FZU5_9BACT|nr:hypothetical protein [Cytophagaceae bacterium SJW1-29]
MNKLIYLGLLTAVTLITGCTSDSPAPSTDISQLQGEYRTNASLDLSCAAITDERQLPQLSVTQKSDGTYTLVRTDFIPSRRTTELTNVTVQSKPDTLLIFRDNQKIGSLYLGTWRDYSGKKVREVTAPMLLVSMNDTISETYFFFLGYRQ